jgi:parallel beta-helix repeat protein
MMAMQYLPGVLSLLLLGCALQASDILVLKEDNTRVDHSCVVRVPEGGVLADADGNGVLQVTADNIVLELEEGSMLRGAAAGHPWDELAGIGVRIEGVTNVVLRGWRVHGFKVGLMARNASGLRVEGGDYSDNYRQRLRSTPAAEDGADWLFPHNNDVTPWRGQYGAALCIESSSNVVVRDVRVRRGQNGILLDRVTHSRIYDNDCSFLSGWGLAMWRSSTNVVSRNAFDFCIRGHVEGVYNRGQDSAGILCFEQSSHNLFVENSATHGGDGFFSFAGRDAIGEVWLEGERERKRKETGKDGGDDSTPFSPELAREMSERGCNGNQLVGNDFSYAAAHGVEITFSEDNVLDGNRIVENAICGLWGGYSSRMHIVSNRFEGNGGMAYGLERGGINMEHASRNWIQGNVFSNNKCGVHLWWDNDAGLLRLPGVAGHPDEVAGNQIVGNRFVLDDLHPFKPLAANDRLIVLQLRDDSGTHLGLNTFADNQLDLALDEAVEFDFPAGYSLAATVSAVVSPKPLGEALGGRHPVGGRADLRGRDKIVLDEWGPWDHASPLVRQREAEAGVHRYELIGLDGSPECRVLEGHLVAEIVPAAIQVDRQLVLRGGAGVTPYKVRIDQGDFEKILEGTIVNAAWDLVFFPWTIDPREDLSGWRWQAGGAEAVRATASSLDFPYGWGGPRDQKISDELTRKGPGSDHFGMIANTRLRLPAGKWRIQTLSDDGIRVRVGDQTVVENWSWHGPTRDEGVFLQEEEGLINITVEHFEIDGYATLSMAILPEAR